MPLSASLKDGTLGPMAKQYRPANGLKALTWAQIEQLDELIHLVCEMTANSQRQGRVEITVKNGHVDLVEFPVIRQRLEPAAA